MFRKRNDEDDLATLITLPVMIPLVFLLFKFLPFHWVLKVLIAFLLIFVGGELISRVITVIRSLLGNANRKVNGHLISLAFLASLVLSILFI